MDNVYEVYYSNEDTPLVKKTKERVEWICSNAKGEYVLDIGCSQGINSILLGREGKKVIGIDVLQEAIDFANDRLKCENDSVQSNVQFLSGDFLQLNMEEKKYDTVIMTEVLEHLESVEDFLAKARGCLKEDGIAIVSVPFGINDYWDHKRTYYLGSLYEHLSRYFIVDEIKYIAKWLGVICKVKNESNLSEVWSIDIQTLLDEERAFYEIERYLVDDNKRVREYNKELKVKVDKWHQETLRLKENLAERKERIALLDSKIKELREKCVNISDVQNVNNQREIQKVARQKECIERRLQTATVRLETLNSKYENAIEQSKAEVVKIERQKECVEKRLETASTRLDTMSRKYEKISKKYDDLYASYDKLLEDYNKVSNMLIVRLYLKIKNCFIRKSKTE